MSSDRKGKLRDTLTDEQFHITQEGGTEAAFTGRYWNHKGDGTYQCVVCGTTLFDSSTKFDSGSGWPSFTAPATDDGVSEHKDMSHGMLRTEVRCKECEAHLGHVFPDGPKEEGGLRYCINSASLDFNERTKK